MIISKKVVSLIYQNKNDMKNTLTFSEKANELIEEMYSVVRPRLNNGKLDKEINYVKCTVEVLDDDHSTVWVKWGQHDCKFIDLPISAAATITDRILEEHN